MKKYLYVLLSLLLVVTLLPAQELAAKKNDNKDVDLWNAVNPLNTTVTFLNTGAHPDDERSDLLAYLSRGLGVKTSSLIANRGEGGQNEIGNELGNALGIIRSNEMKEAAKITGVQAYHLSETTSDPIYDFGFSKSPEETLEKWGETLTYERFIRFIRSYKPDILMPSFRNVKSQHGHHRAMSILSIRAFEDAADPTVFPDQIEEDGLSVWQVKKVYLPAESEEKATTSIEIGDYDPIYEKSYPQIGEQSRYLHKSQGMGKDVPVEPRQSHLELVKSVDYTDKGIFTNIPYDFNEWSEIVSDDGISNDLAELQESLDEIVDLYPDREAILPNSQQALQDVQALSEAIENGTMSEDVKKELDHKLTLKEKQLQKVSLIASGLEVEATPASKVITKGEKTQIDMSITNNGDQSIHQVSAGLIAPEDWKITTKDEAEIDILEAGESKNVTFQVNVSADAEHYHPYDDPLIQPRITFEEEGTKTVNLLELEETFAVLPELGVSTEPEDIVVNTADVEDSYDVKVNIKNYYNGAKKGSVSLNLPEGWTSEPKEVDVSLEKRLEEQQASFKVIPPEDVEKGEFNIGAMVESGKNVFDTTVQEISYDHIKDSFFLYPSTMDGVAFELLKPDSLKIGYIESGFDEVADYLLELGFNVTKLTEADLSTGDLDQFDTIVTGIRANLAREDLIENNDRLLEYAENGGHVVVQYHKPGDNWDKDKTPPYELEIGSPSIEWRVTDENAEVTMTKPDHPLFNFPNNITDKDWDGWVQERGLYFPSEWDDHYETFVSMADPNEDSFDSGILMTDYGEGSYIYTNLVFYRQIANQVPGGYRIFTNLLSYGTEESAEIRADEIKAKVERFADEGEFEDETTVRALTTHLSAVSHYEDKGTGGKIVKHMNGFKQLIAYHKKKDLISEEAFETLDNDADVLIDKWL
ncbi:PIG-L family deacetylase [Lentibacillus salicampi]|uniref:Uncharacterized protein n=1 Tax=Lentibacillus salicampi TaxID=175306 RepID=A0A4Y9AE07_9BACI|nr:PIG-L family deacetylase [Lentibacillus salicampi]TFJ93180.1 hypothetical protein E4U82_08235 [Lentibacillus salicampi]